MNLTAKTFQGLEEVLAKELEALGAWNIKPARRAVSFDSNKEILYKSNLHLRTALKVLQPISSFKARNEKELYQKVLEYNWSAFLRPDQTFAVDAVTFSDIFTHSKFVALKTKDAIADHFRNKTGQRPNVSLIKPNLQVNVHIARDQVTLSLDSSGDSLHKRGYRSGDHKAPLNEVLAAGMILLSGWDKKTPFLDPMCGTGTIVMEAAMMAANIPAGNNRKEFGFMRWNNFDKDLWEKIKTEAKDQIVFPGVKIIGGDIDIKAIDIARQSALDFHLKRYIQFVHTSFSDYLPENKSGIIITNPPYGERLVPKDIIALYKSIGNHLKKNFHGFDAWIISSNQEALKQLGLKPEKKYTLYNGALECKYEKFSLFEGTYKDQKANG